MADVNAATAAEALSSASRTVLAHYRQQLRTRRLYTLHRAGGLRHRARGVAELRQ